MRVFYGGQIKEEHRGTLAVVINRGEQGRSEVYSVLIEDALSDEFTYLTGVGSVNMPPERVYIGVSPGVGKTIASVVNRQYVKETNLKSIDGLVVQPHFLDKNLETPDKITLVNTPRGWQVQPETPPKD